MPSPISLPGHLQVDEAAAIRQQIQTIAPQLFDLLDPQWQQYLALPNELFAEESGSQYRGIEKGSRSLRHGTSQSAIHTTFLSQRVPDTSSIAETLHRH